ncbi:MAG: transglutaminase-like domain-containing protein [Gemmatimonadales bacterium]
MTRLSTRGAIGRRTAGSLILLGWVCALAWLVGRNYMGKPAENSIRWPVPPGSTYMAIRLGERQVGLRTFVIDTLESGVRAVELVTLDQPEFTKGVARRTSFTNEALYSRGLQLKTFRTQILTEWGRELRTGEVFGDTLLQLVSQADYVQPETLTIRLRRPVILPSGLPLVIASRGIPRVGDRLNLEVFDPMAKQLRLDRITVGAESVFVVPDSAEYNENLKRWSVVHSDTVRAWRLDGVAGGLPEMRWVDGAGMLVRIRYPLGATVDRSAFEMVQTNWRALPPPVWDSADAAPRFTLDTTAPPGRSRLVARVRLADPDDTLPAIPSLAGGWQERMGDSLVVQRNGGAASDSEPDPKAGPFWSLSQADSGLMEIAMKAAGRDPRPEAMASEIQAWVVRNVALRPLPGLTSPQRVLAQKKGNDTERSLLIAMLAQTMGMPARTVWGVVRIHDTWQLRTWAEVWTGRWTPLDPALPPKATDAGRVRLGEGVGTLMGLALRAGRVRLDVLEAVR